MEDDSKIESGAMALIRAILRRSGEALEGASMEELCRAFFGEDEDAEC